jgi:ubiquinone/menaquinone biosynthesis C-methylase UbiE
MPAARLRSVLRSPLRGVSEVWRADHPWAPVYDFVVEREPLAGVAWRVAMGSDVHLLYAAAAEVGGLPDGATVLDVPCGGGVALRGLRPEQQLRYVAADISVPMLQRTAANAATRRLSRVECLQTDVAHLPFPDGAVDLCVSFTGLHCFPDPEAAVHEIARVLRPGGVLTGSAFLNDTGLRYDAIRRLGRAGGLLGRSATRAELRTWLAAAGVENLTLRTSGALVYFRGVRGPGLRPVALARD